MSAFNMTFDCDNAAFSNDGDFDSGEVERILKDVASEIRNCHTSGKVFDYNGNRVGSWTLEIDDPETEDEDEENEDD